MFLSTSFCCIRLSKPDEVLRVWGTNIDTEMSESPRTLATVDDAMRWLYAAPPAPAAVPLTDEQIGALWDNHIVPVFGKNGINPIVFARAIERAHGIAAAGEKP